MFSLVSLSQPLLLLLSVSSSAHSRRPLFCLLLLSCPFFLAFSPCWFESSIASRCVIEARYIININWLGVRACARINEAACVRACVLPATLENVNVNWQRCSPKMINKSTRSRRIQINLNFKNRHLFMRTKYDYFILLYTIRITMI